MIIGHIEKKKEKYQFNVCNLEINVEELFNKCRWMTC